MVPTNGVVWILYHLSFGKGIRYATAFSVDLASDAIDKAAEKPGLLHKHSIAKGELEDYWQKRSRAQARVDRSGDLHGSYIEGHSARDPSP